MTNKLHRRIPFLRRLYAQRDNARAERDSVYEQSEMLLRKLFLRMINTK